MKLSTRLINEGYQSELSEGSLVTPIFRTSTFCFPNSESGKRSFELAYHLDKPKKNEYPPLIYSRVNNPNMEILESRLSILNHSEKSLVFSSGMGAISNTCLSFLKPGDSLVYSEPVYGGTDFLFKHTLPNFGIKCYPIGQQVSSEDITDLLKTTLNLKVIFIETPCNPLLKLTSIHEISSIRDKIRPEALLVVDNTMIGPIYTQPLNFGANLVVYSITKFIGGHSDLIAGGVSGSQDLITKIKVSRTIFGNILDPDTCWLIKRSLSTLQLRMDQQSKNTQKIVSFLQSHPQVRKIYYPGIGSEKEKKIFQQEYKNGGSIISFELNGDERLSFKVLNKFKIFKLAVSLGSVESLVQHPSSMTHSDMTPEHKQRVGITDSLIRMSVGLENDEDLIQDLQQALD
jgi:methionine-gamma-lyase